MTDKDSRPGEARPALPAGAANPAPPALATPGKVAEIGGFKGPEPTRYGDWEHNGRCTDF